MFFGLAYHLLFFRNKLLSLCRLELDPAASTPSLLPWLLAARTAEEAAPPACSPGGRRPSSVPVTPPSEAAEAAEPAQWRSRAGLPITDWENRQEKNHHIPYTTFSEFCINTSVWQK